jgi:type IV secretory pathway VirB10-like protein
MEQKSKNHKVLYALLVGFVVLIVVYFTFFAGSKDTKKDEPKTKTDVKPDDRKDDAATKPLQNPPPRTTNPNLPNPTQPNPVLVVELNPQTLQKEVVEKTL